MSISTRNDMVSEGQRDSRDSNSERTPPDNGTGSTGAGLDALIRNVQGGLEDNGPPVDYGLIDDFIDGVLSADLGENVMKKIMTWKNWHEAYWETRAFSHDLPEET